VSTPDATGRCSPEDFAQLEQKRRRLVEGQGSGTSGTIDSFFPDDPRSLSWDECLIERRVLRDESATDFSQRTSLSFCISALGLNVNKGAW
jgi:hypothetical protein